MKAIYVPFTNRGFELIFEDDQLADTFQTVFQAPASLIGSIDHTININGNGDTSYSVYLNGRLIRKAMARNEAAYCVTRIFGDDICFHTDDSTCIMHAASVLMRDGVVAFSGVSGAGKTTLSLLFSQYGTYMGDEYAFLDIETGDLWHEQYPFQLKAGNKAVLSNLDPSLTLEVEGEPFGRACFVSLATTNYRKVERNHHLKVKMIVFPHFEGTCPITMINKLPASELPVAILQSLMGQDVPSRLFKRFMQMAAAKNLNFVEVKFSDGIDAAAKLFDYINQSTEAMDE